MKSYSRTIENDNYRTELPYGAVDPYIFYILYHFNR